jgi:hypothetical protein
MESAKGTRPTCEAVQNLFLLWVDEELEHEFAKGLEAHLQGCSHCASQWEGYRATVKALKAMEPLEVPDRVLLGIRERLQRPTLWEKAARWILPLPQRIPSPVLATAAVLFIAVGIWRWAPWSPDGSPTSGPAVAVRTSPAPILGAAPISHDWNPYARRILPGTEEIMSPARALEDEQERSLAPRAALQDDLVLDLSGSEEIFNRIQGIISESRGQMFMMGIRHRGSGQVVRSRMLIHVPMENYSKVIQQIESIAPTHHLFMDRDAIPPAPDRLRVRVVAVDAPQGALMTPFQGVSVE